MSKLLNLIPWRRRRLEHDLEREMRHHIEMRVEDLQRSGLSEEQARRRAAIELGGVTQVKEETRETWIWRWLEDFGRDLRYAGRMLRRSPGFTITAVLSLALGIGANAAIFALFNQVLLQHLPVRDPHQLVLLDWQGNAVGANWGSGNLLSYPLCRDLQQQTQFFDGVLCRHPAEAILSAGQQSEPGNIEVVSGSFFEVLAVVPEMGRLIASSDDVTQDAHPVVVVSHHYWKNKLGGAPDVVGRKLFVNTHPMTIIGVAPASFRGIDLAAVPALWIPAMMKRQATPEFDELFNRRAHWMHVFARLKPGVTVEQARTGLQPWFRSMLEADTHLPEFPKLTTEQRNRFLASTIGVVPAPGGRSNLRNRIQEPLRALMAGTLLLLLLAGVNVANLFLARGAARVREVTTRLALGASQGRITSQLLAESMLISLMGGALGLVLAPFVAEVLLAFVSDTLKPQMDRTVFVLAFGVCVLTGTVCGLVPAFRATRSTLIGSLRDRAGIGTGVRLRKALVVGQMAFTLILLIGVGLFVQTLQHLIAKGPGLDSSGLLMFRVDTISNGYSESDGKRVMRELLRKLNELPGVERAAIANSHVLTGGTSSSSMTIQSHERIVSNRAVHFMRVSPGLFETIGARLLAGRDFDDRDLREPGSKDANYRSIIISESFAKRYFGDRNPLGSRLGFGNRPGVVTNMEIIGVVRGFSRRSLRDDIEQVFVPYWDRNSGDGSFYVKVHGAPQAALGSIRAAVAEVDPALPLIQPVTLDEQMERSLATERMLATLSTGFGAIALTLSVVGLYGVMSFIVTRRTQEIGVRLALGASRGGVVWLVGKDALVMIAMGAAIALPAAWSLRRLVESQLFGVSAVHPPTIAAATALLAVVALGAAMLPSWRATRISPVQALRPE